MINIILVSFVFISSTFSAAAEDRRIKILNSVLKDLTTSTTLDYELFEEKYMVKAEVSREIKDFFCTLFEETLEQNYRKKNRRTFSLIPYNEFTPDQKSRLLIGDLKDRVNDIYGIRRNKQELHFILFLDDKIEHFFTLDTGHGAYLGEITTLVPGYKSSEFVIPLIEKFLLEN